MGLDGLKGVVRGSLWGTDVAEVGIDDHGAFEPQHKREAYARHRIIISSHTYFGDCDITLEDCLPQEKDHDVRTIPLMGNFQRIVHWKSPD